MPSTDQEKVKALYDAAQDNLSQYLAKAGYQRPYTAAEMDEFDRARTYKIERVKHPIQADKFIYLGSRFRNESLLALRVANVLETKKVINAALLDIPGDLNPNMEFWRQNGLKNCARKLEEALAKGDDANHALSVSHGKSHVSTQQNRFLGMGFLASLWNRSWFQSRANTAFEKCFAQLREFKNENFGDANFSLGTVSESNYLRLKAVVQAALRQLSKYLSQVGYQRAYSSEDLYRYNSNKHKKNRMNAIEHLYQSRKYIMVDRKVGDKELTATRVQEVTKTIGALQMHIDFSIRNLDDAILSEKLTIAGSLLWSAQSDNAKLSAKYGKKHVTYAESRAKGYSWYASLWNRTLFQSRANTAYERAREEIAKYQPSLPARS